MAIKHGNSRTLYTSNQSSACLGYCDPSCPYSCSDYFPAPPPSESSTLPQPAPSYSGGTSSNNHRFPPSIIFIIAFLGGAFLIVSYYVIISKSYLWYRSRRNGSPLNNNRSTSDESDGGGDGFHDGTRIDHPIWYIRTIGLSNAVINSITAVKYDKSTGLIEGTDCTVCLSEFREGEALRVLPKCNHAFHVKCIDTWLGSHVNCPLCRAHVVVSSRHSVFDENINSISRHGLEESQRNIDYSGNLSSREETQTEGTFVNNSNLVGSDVEARNNSGVLRMIPESVHDGRDTLLPEGNGGRDSKERFVGSNGFLGQVPSDVDRHILVDVEEMGLGRRSISMDFNPRISNSHVEEIRIDVGDGNPTVSEVTENDDDQQPKSGDTSVSNSDSNRDTSTTK